MSGMDGAGRVCLGLTIQLKKQGFMKKLDIEHQNILLGFYDYLEIRRIEKWFDFSPRNYTVRNSETINSYLVTTHYPIKLLFPEFNTVTTLVQSANYTRWSKPEELLEDAPCASIILLNLTDEFKATCVNCVVEMAQIISEHYSDVKLENAHCSIFQTLGYSDLCILMADQNWEFALNLIDYLRSYNKKEDKNGNQEKKIPVLSTEYMLPLYHVSNDCKKSGQSAFANSQLSVRLNLYPGCTSQMIKQLMPAGVKVYNTSGGSDCLLLAEDAQSASDLFEYLVEFSGNKNRFTNFAIDISSSVQNEVECTDIHICSEQFLDSFSSGKELLESVAKFYETAIYYEELLKDKKQHVRIISLMHEFVAVVENVCSRPHSRKIREIVVPFLNNFTACLKQSRDELLETSYAISDELSLVESSVENICRNVRSFLLDLSRADSLYMEKEQYDHPSVSSSTELLLAYNRWLDNFSRRVQNATLVNNNSSYSFIVTSGGCDQTSTKNYFYFLYPRIKDNNSPIEEDIPLLIRMSEMSLFDFSGTIFRVTHECMHFCGERFRRVRAKNVVKFVARFYGECLVWQLFGERYMNDIIDRMNFLYRDKFTGKMRKRVRRYYKAARGKLKSQIADEIEKSLDSVVDKFTMEIDFFARNIVAEFGIALTQLFSSLTSDEWLFDLSDFAEFIIEKRNVAIATFNQKCDKMLLLKDSNSLLCAFNFAHQKVYEKSREFKGGEDFYVQMTLSAFLMNDEIFSVNKELKDRGEKKGQNDIFYDNAANNIFAVLESVNDIFKESFADVAACSILKPSFVDYIMMHIFEDWDIERALYNSFANEYRIPAVLHLCFPDCLSDGKKITQEAQNELQCAVETLNAHGVPREHFDVNECVYTITRILNEFLGKYNLQKDIVVSLESYLVPCKELYERVRVQLAEKDRIDYQEKYQEIRLLNIDPKDDNLKEKIIKMVENFVEEM